MNQSLNNFTLSIIDNSLKYNSSVEYIKQVGLDSCNIYYIQPLEKAFLLIGLLAILSLLVYFKARNLYFITTSLLMIVTCFIGAYLFKAYYLLVVILFYTIIFVVEFSKLRIKEKEN